MVPDVRLETAGADAAKQLAGAFEGDPVQTGALTFSLDALVGDPPAPHASLSIANPTRLAYIACVSQDTIGSLWARHLCKMLQRPQKRATPVGGRD